jgi:hypothetical protein
VDGNDRENEMTHLSYPGGEIVDQLDQIYVVDNHHNRVMCW